MTGLVPRVLLLAALVATTLSAQPAPIPQHLVFTPYRASGIYDVGDTVGWTVTPATSPSTYAFKWTIRRNNAVVRRYYDDPWGGAPWSGRNRSFFGRGPW